jgi:hypothetical protein
MNLPALVGLPPGRVGGTCGRRLLPCEGREACVADPEPELGDQPLGAEVPWTPQVDWLLLSKETLPVDRGGYALLLLLLPW